VKPPRLDFASPPGNGCGHAQRSPWLWALLAVAAASLVMAAWDAAAHWQALQSARGAVQEHTLRAQPPARDTSARVGRASPRSDRLHAQALHSLHRPWMPLLETVERAGQAPVALRQWSVDARFTRLQLELESRALPEVFAYVSELQRLAQAEPLGPLGAVQLLGHEWLGPAQSPYVRARVAVMLRLQQGLQLVDEPVITPGTRTAQQAGTLERTP
jgi:hypothetical protein